jgi:hypothetical protein
MQLKAGYPLNVAVKDFALQALGVDKIRRRYRFTPG